MSIEHVLGVLPVANFEAAHAWYEHLFDRPADNLPLAGRLVEWRVSENGWVQVTIDADRDGAGLLNFAVDDLDRQTTDICGRGLAPGAIETVNTGAQLTAVTDRDVSRITFIGDFRVKHQRHARSRRSPGPAPGIGDRSPIRLRRPGVQLPGQPVITGLPSVSDTHRALTSVLE